MATEVTQDLTESECRTLVVLIAECKNTILKYKTSPLCEIPKADRLPFNLAWVLLQAAMDRDGFFEFIKEGR